MTAARRAAKTERVFDWWVWVLLVLVLLVGFLLGSVNGKVQPRVQPVPVPGPTWTSYIPETPSVCRDAMDAADDMLGASVAYSTTVSKVAELKVAGRLDAAVRLSKRADGELKVLGAAERKYSALAKRCKQ